MEHIRSLENVSISEEQKAKIINEINESFETILNIEASNILEILNIFINYLKNGDYQFFSESTIQKVNLIYFVHFLGVTLFLKNLFNRLGKQSWK
jgi:phenylpyruvate tautomerase PptA (4-oxalocrotonate tautomerase family)